MPFIRSRFLPTIADGQFDASTVASYTRWLESQAQARVMEFLEGFYSHMDGAWGLLVLFDSGRYGLSGCFENKYQIRKGMLTIPMDLRLIYPCKKEEGLEALIERLEAEEEYVIQKQSWQLKKRGNESAIAQLEMAFDREHFFRERVLAGSPILESDVEAALKFGY